MFYTFEHGFPQLYHYRIIELGTISTGETKFQKIQKALNDDMILDHVKRNLVVRLFCGQLVALYCLAAIASPEVETQIF